MSELTDIIDTLRRVARRFTDYADNEERSTYYADQEVKKRKVDKYRKRATKLEDAANLVAAVKVDLDSDG